MLLCVVVVVCCLFGRLGGSLWVLGVVLGGHFGRLGAVLEAVDGQGCRASNFPPVLDRFLDPSWVPKGRQDGAQDETWRPQDDPRGHQDGTQDDQNRSKNRLRKRSRLRAVLRPSWGDLGPALGSILAIFYWKT